MTLWKNKILAFAADIGGTGFTPDEQTPDTPPDTSGSPHKNIPPEGKPHKQASRNSLDEIYRMLYFLGLRLLRMFYKRRRKMMRRLRTFHDKQLRKRELRRRGMRSQIRVFLSTLSAPVRDVKRRYRKLLGQLDSEKRYGTDWRVASVYGRMAWFAIKKLWQLIRILFNYVAPVAACIFLFSTVQQQMNQTYALKVTYDGEEIGYISDESVYNQANQEMLARMVGEEFFTSKQVRPKYELVTASADELLRVDELTNLLIQSSGSDLQQANGLYIESTVDGRTQMRLMGAVEDGNGLLRYLNSVLEEYRTPEMSEDAKISFVKKLALKPGLYPQTMIRSVQEMSDELDGVEKNELRYTVVSGDTPLRIATKTGISFEELKRMNPGVEENLQPGDTLLVSQSVARMSVKVAVTEKVEEELDFTIRQETVPTMDIGWTNLKQKGEKGIVEVVSEVVMIDGVEVSRTELNKTKLKDPKEEILQVGGNRPLTVVPKTSAGSLPSGTFAWPTIAGTVSCHFLGYYGHTGTDIMWPGCYGYPILASADGVVVVAKWNGGAYGNYVIIEHGGGVRTLYAHASRLDVQVGDQVKQGQQIAAIGSTGRSTGPHVHFEVIINGTPVNAMNYLAR